jgi:hypothetical protein
MKTTQLSSQPIPNPNNKVAQPVFNSELQPFPTYLITPVELQDIQLRLGKVVNKNYPIIIEKEPKEETPNKINSDDKIKQTSTNLEPP